MSKLSNNHWQPINSAPENLIVFTKIDDGRGKRNEQCLIRKGNLWWVPEGTVYVYYTPTHWKYIR